MIIGTLVTILFYIYWHFSHDGTIQSAFKNPIKLFVFIIIGVCITFLQFLIDNLFNSIISWHKYFLLRLLAGISSILILSTLIIIPAIYLNVLNKETELPKLLVIVFMFSIIYQVIYGLVYAYLYFSILQIEKVKSERLQLSLQFQSLKNQISPHYLFNCLNTISALIYKNPQTAEKFIRRMTDTFQYVLGWQKQKLVPLKEEIDFVKAYFFLLQSRYENQIALDIALAPETYQTVIPPLSIQLLVENAVKHNDMSVENPLTIQIKSDKDNITVSNVIQARIKKADSLQIGLQNIQQRYAFFTDRKIQINQEHHFTVTLPVLKNQDELKKIAKLHEA